MMLEALPHIVSGLVLLVVGWGATHLRELRKTLRDLEIRMVKVETQATSEANSRSEIRQELVDIRENMVRRDDMNSLRDALSQRIEDLRR